MLSLTLAHTQSVQRIRKDALTSQIPEELSLYTLEYPHNVCITKCQMQKKGERFTHSLARPKCMFFTLF